MKTEAQIRERLENMKLLQEGCMKKRLMWSYTDITHNISELEWVLGDDKK